MSNNSSIMFRKSIGGYNKADVNSYIEALSIRERKNAEKFEETISKLREELAGINEKLKIAEARDFSEEAAVFNEKIGELERKLAESEKIIALKTEEIDKLSEKNKLLDSEMLLLNEKLNKNSELVKAAQEKLAKAEQYDSISCRIGEVLLEAENRADDIVASARKKSDSIIGSAEEKREKTVEALEKYSELYREKLSEITVASAKERIEKMNTRMDEFRDSLSRTIDDASNNSDVYGSCIDDLKSSLKESIGRILSENIADNNGKDKDSAGEIEKMINEAADSVISRLNNEL